MHRSRKPCRFGAHCTRSDCSFEHPSRGSVNRSIAHMQCRYGKECYNSECKYHHPRARRVCEDAERCRFSDCRLAHPPRNKVCKHGMECKRAKEVCEYLHPWDWYEECKTVVIDPLEVLFTHDKLSDSFQDGEGVDVIIDEIRDGTFDFSDFPPMEIITIPRKELRKHGYRALAEEVHKQEGPLLFSLNNRRLFVARVARNHGWLERVSVHQYEFESARVQRVDERSKDKRPKWQRALTTTNNGDGVSIKSQYAGSEVRPRRSFHIGIDQHQHHGMETASTTPLLCAPRHSNDAQTQGKKNEASSSYPCIFLCIMFAAVLVTYAMMKLP